MGLATVDTTTAALKQFGEHLKLIPVGTGGVRQVVTDYVDPFITAPQELPTVYVEDVQSTNQEPYSGSNTFLRLQWIVTVWTANKGETRLLLARIANLYRNLNETGAGGRFAALQALGICGIKEVEGSRVLDLMAPSKTNHCGQTVMEAIYQETALPL